MIDQLAANKNAEPMIKRATTIDMNADGLSGFGLLAAETTR